MLGLTSASWVLRLYRRGRLLSAVTSFEALGARGTENPVGSPKCGVDQGQLPTQRRGVRFPNTEARSRNETSVVESILSL